MFFLTWRNISCLLRTARYCLTVVISVIILRWFCTSIYTVAPTVAFFFSYHPVIAAMEASSGTDSDVQTGVKPNWWIQAPETSTQLQLVDANSIRSLSIPDLVSIARIIFFIAWRMCSSSYGYLPLQCRPGQIHSLNSCGKLEFIRYWRH